MIELNITINGASVIQERELTAEELVNVTSIKTDVANLKRKFYQGDEPAYVISLDEAKFIKKNAIQEKTETLLYAGFTFDNKTFGLTSDESRKWLGLRLAQSSEFPINVVSKEGQIEQLNDSTVIDFYNAAFNRARNIEEGGGALKYQVNQCTTIEQVNAITDNRE
jgi:hypothetical protein